LGVGSHSFTAQYTGSFDSSTSNTAAVTVSGATATRYHFTPILSDLPGLPNGGDRLLKNPWGLTFIPGGAFWTAENQSSNVSAFDETGAKQSPFDIRVELANFGAAKPTGIVFNPTAAVHNGDFTLPNGDPGQVLFSTEDGIIGGWGTVNGEILVVAPIARDDSASGAVYKGLAIVAPQVSSPYLAVADFFHARVQTFSNTFASLTTAGGFADPSLPDGYAPFNIQTIGTQVFVTYAMQDTAKHDPVVGSGNGIVNIFDLQGNFVRRFSANGVLNAPWGIIQASANFGDFSNDILIGNFGDGTINAFDPATGNLVGTMEDEDGAVIAAPIMWGLTFRSDNGTVDPNTLFFVQGQNHGADGLFGSLTVAPLTATITPTVAVSFSGDPSTNTLPPNAEPFSTIFSLNADVTAASGTPTGAVSFFDGLTPLGSAPVTNGRASVVNTVPLSVGSHVITARYSGDATFLLTKTTAPLQIVGLAETVTLDVPATAVVGSTVTLTAKVSSTQAQPTGTVTFQDGAAALGTASLNPSGTATLSLNSLTPGTHTIVAVYSGDFAFQIGMSSPATLTVQTAAAPGPTATTTTLSIASGGNSVSSGGSVAIGSQVTLTAAVMAGTTPVPQGQVNFCDASAPSCTDIHLLGSAQLIDAGQGIGTVVFRFHPGIGNHSYKAVFAGTPRGSTAYAASTSSTVALIVTGSFPTKTSLVGSGTQGNYSLTATVTGLVNASGVAAPSGTVSFLDTSSGNISLASAALGAGTQILSFQNSSNAAAEGANGPSMAVGDFNSDGIPDLAVANEDDDSVTIFLGDGSGAFTPATNSPVVVGVAPASIAMADFNGDGKADLAVANLGDNTVTILLGNGDGTFTHATGSPITVGRGPISIAAGDFSGDGVPDLAVANVTDNTVTILLGNGNGTFTQAAGSPLALIGSSPSSVAIADFNGDGKLDFAVAIVGPNNVTTFLGNGDGTFTKAAGSPAATGLGPISVAVGDFNRDGIPDLVTANDADVNDNPGTLTILLGDGSGGFTQAGGSPIAAGINPVSVAVADFNGDGIADLVALAANDTTVTILLGHGDGTFMRAAGSPGTVGIFPAAVAVGDFNGDGEADFAETNNPSETNTRTQVSVFISQLTQTATATATGISPVGTGTHLVVAETSFPVDSIYISSVSNAIGLLGQQARPITPTVVVTPSTSAITTAQALSVAIAVSGGGGNPTPTGSVTLTSGTYMSAATTLSSGAATISIPAGSLATGTDTLTASYTPDAASSSTYNSSNGSNSVIVMTAVGPAFSVGGTAVTLAPGAATGNTSTITLTPSGGFTGSVALTAAITASPAGAQDLPTLSFGSTSPVSINNAAAGTAILTISTTAPTSASLVSPRSFRGVFWHTVPSAALAFILFFATPGQRRRWRTMLGMLMLLAALAGGMLACGAGGGGSKGGGGHGSPGTTAGIYTVTVTGTSGATAATGTLTLTVQ
ncbi:MAG: TIGR03118 family protein, partial [Terracidiphilus sp.]